MLEELVDRFTQDGCLVRQACFPVEINHQGERPVLWKVFGPADDELFRSGIQVPVAKRRWIDRVEQLLQFAYMHLNNCALGWKGISCGGWQLCHRLFRCFSRENFNHSDTFD